MGLHELGGIDRPGRGTVDQGGDGSKVRVRLRVQEDEVLVDQSFFVGFDGRSLSRLERCAT